MSSQIGAWHLPRGYVGTDKPYHRTCELLPAPKCD